MAAITMENPIGSPAATPSTPYIHVPNRTLVELEIISLLDKFRDQSLCDGNAVRDGLLDLLNLVKE